MHFISVRGEVEGRRTGGHQLTQTGELVVDDLTTGSLRFHKQFQCKACVPTADTEKLWKRAEMSAGGDVLSGGEMSVCP